ncbi:MAG: hypothetical protein GF334_00535 [Candidatus Altiarchaeales archaeon]|nr:hypothetical protein [Candidatus Altiarchaeales archaeon]
MLNEADHVCINGVCEADSFDGSGNKTVIETDENGVAQFTVVGVESGKLNVSVSEPSGSVDVMEVWVPVRKLDVVASLPSFFTVRRNGLFNFTVEVVCFDKNGCKDLSATLDPIKILEGII